MRVDHVLLVCCAVSLTHSTPATAQVSATIAAQYMAVAESAGTATPATRAAWQQRVDRAQDTLQKVLDWNNKNGQRNASLRMLLGLRRFWNGPALVGAYENALAGPIGTDTALRARALNSAAAAAFRINDQARTRLWARQSIGLSAVLHDSAAMGRAYERLVQAALRDGDHPQLRAIADTGQMLCARARDADCVAYLMNMRGESARVLKQYDSAAAYYSQADSIYRAISPVFRLDIAHNIGFTLLALGRSGEARRRFSEALQHAVAIGDRPNTAFLIAGVASSEATDGRAATAARLFGLYDVLLEQTGLVADPADAVEYERYRALARGALGSSAFDAVLQEGRKLPVDSVLATLR